MNTREKLNQKYDEYRLKCLHALYKRDWNEIDTQAARLSSLTRYFRLIDGRTELPPIKQKESDENA